MSTPARFTSKRAAAPKSLKPLRSSPTPYPLAGEHHHHGEHHHPAVQQAGPPPGPPPTGRLTRGCPLPLRCTPRIGESLLDGGTPCVCVA